MTIETTGNSSHEFREFFFQEEEFAPDFDEDDFEDFDDDDCYEALGDQEVEGQ